ncbi:MAG: hypothetical protein IJ449_11395 [Clostridia bacterium]|nr:hypothetical protein [Clostridia bacterium]
MFQTHSIFPISPSPNRHPVVRRIATGLTAALLSVGCLCAFTACGSSAAKDCTAMDAEAVSFDATVYYARDGRIRFLYDSDTDMLSAIEGCDMAALYSGSVYSMVISYSEGTMSRGDADTLVKSEFDSGDGTISLSSGSKAVDVSGHTFRRAEITCADGSTGAVLYGSTATGFAEIYYLLSPDAAESDRAHVEEILATVKLAEFEADDGGDDVKIYVE